MESAPDLQMTIVLTLCLLYKIISTEAISAIAIEVVNKTHTQTHTLSVVILSKGSFPHVPPFWFMRNMKLIERYLYLYFKNLGFDPDNY